MKMVRAIIRPEKTEEVVDALAGKGYIALTRIDVVGRGKQKGIVAGNVYYDELSKVMLMLVVEDGNAQEVVDTVNEAAYTGNFGDGKVFITPVDTAYTDANRKPGVVDGRRGKLERGRCHYQAQ